MIKKGGGKKGNVGGGVNPLCGWMLRSKKRGGRKLKCLLGRMVPGTNTIWGMVQLMGARKKETMLDLRKAKKIF